MIELIFLEDAPCWYEISWQGEPPSLIFRFHEDFLKEIEDKKLDLAGSPIVTHFKREFGLSEFATNFRNGNLGFSSCFKAVQTPKEGFTEFVVAIPEVEHYSDKKCRTCGGRGKDRFRDKCFDCGGSGKERKIDFTSAYEISATFSVISSLNWVHEKNTSSHTSQLLTVETITGKEMHGGSLGGEVSVTLTNWMRAIHVKHGEVEVAEAIKAMKTAYQKMFRSHHSDSFLGRFEFRIREGGAFCSDCPGNACGLHPENWSELRDGRGHHFSCHNVDSPAQQITLIAGLAALCDVARKEMKNE